MSKEGEVVCVTGGSGFIGSWLVHLLLQRGYTVHATVKDLSTLSLLPSAPFIAWIFPFFNSRLLKEHNIIFLRSIPLGKLQFMSATNIILQTLTCCDFVLLVLLIFLLDGCYVRGYAFKFP